MTNDMTFAILVVAAAAALIVYLDIEVSSAVERKHDEILSDYPEILSKLTLLVNAGMVIRDANDQGSLLPATGPCIRRCS